MLIGQKKVKLIKYDSYKSSWCTSHIGEVFDVVKADALHYYVVEDGVMSNKLLNIKDCIDVN